MGDASERLDSMMASYTDALKKFSESAKLFLPHVHLLTQAHDAYKEAIAASAQLRAVLDAGDEDLQTIMTELEQAISAVFAKTALGEKKPEPPLRLQAAMKAANGGQSSGVVKTIS